MKKLNLTEQKGIAQIFLLVGMLLVAISLPIATKLVQQNQENRSNAATKTTCFCYVGSSQGVKVTGGSTSSLSSCKSKCTAGACKCTTTTTATTVASPAKVTCSSYTYSSWSPSTCPSSGKQTRNVTGKSPDGCSGGSPVTSRTCTYVAKTDTSKSNGSTCASNSECSSGFCNSLTKKCESKPKSNGSACSSNSDCASGYCSNKKCAATTTCTWTCTAWTACSKSSGSGSSGVQYCNSQTKSPSNCTGGTSVTSRPCAYTAPETCVYTCNEWGLCNSTGKKYCYSQTASPTDCTGGTKITSVGCTYVAPAANTTYYYNNGTSCVGKVFASPDACQATTGKTCYASEASCKSSTTKTLYYHYSSSAKTCYGVSYDSISACSAAYGSCYTSKSACESIASCGSLTTSKLCETYGCVWDTSAKKCVSSLTANLCGPGASPNRDHYPMAGSYCVAGATYKMVDDKGKDGEYNWTCTKDGVTKDCVSSKKKSGSGGGGGSDSGSYYIPGSLSLNQSSLTLKVGQSAAVVASESVTWSSDKAAVATVTANGVITGVTVGTATVTATSTSGETATVAVTVIASGTGTLSFKIAFAGIKPVYTNSSGTSYHCLGSMGTVTVEVLNRPTNAYQKFSDVPVSVKGNEIDSKGNQIFEVDNLEVGSSLVGVNTFNYVKIKGPFHLKRRMCKDGQTGKLDETTTCDINLGKTDGVPYDFSEYTLLAGDADQNGRINSVDFSMVKNAVNADVEPECGREYDLNMDGVVNSLDLNLVKDALSSIDDE